MFARHSVCLAAGVALAALIGACDDPSVQVNFEVPAQYRAQVATVALHIVVPPEGDDEFTCSDIAFRTVDADTVRLTTVKEFVQRDEDHLQISGIPREGTKLLFIEGIDDQDLPVVAACERVDLIDGDIVIDLVGEPTALVTLPTLDPGEPFEPEIEIRVADIDGTPLGRIDVRWRTTGPGGETIDGEGRTAMSGRIDIPTAVPARPGPAALDVRARWMRTDPGPLLAFNAPASLFFGALPGTAAQSPASAESLYAVGRIGPNGEPGFVALGPADNPLLGRELYIAYYDDSLVPPFRVVTPGTIVGALSIGLIERGGIDHPVTLTPTQWIEIEPNGALTAQPLPSPQLSAVKILSVGSCDASGMGNERILVQHGDLAPVIRVYDASGQIVADSWFTSNPQLSRPSAAGCVESVDGGVHRTAVFNTSPLSQVFLTEMDSGRQGAVPALRNGIGFSPADATAGARLLATELTIDGTTISRYRLAAIGDAADAERVDSDQTVSIPQSLVGGNFDGDEAVDIVAALPFGTSIVGSPQIRLLMAMGTLISVRDQRLVGLSAGVDGERVAMWAVDFDENGIDDLLIASPTGFLILDMGEP